jgi:hypothetical protein
MVNSNHSTVLDPRCTQCEVAKLPVTSLSSAFKRYRMMGAAGQVYHYTRASSQGPRPSMRKKMIEACISILPLSYNLLSYHPCWWSGMVTLEQNIWANTTVYYHTVHVDDLVLINLFYITCYNIIFYKYFENMWTHVIGLENSTHRW